VIAWKESWSCDMLGPWWLVQTCTTTVRTSTINQLQHIINFYRCVYRFQQTAAAAECQFITVYDCQFTACTDEFIRRLTGTVRICEAAVNCGGCGSVVRLGLVRISYGWWLLWMQVYQAINFFKQLMYGPTICVYN